MASSNDASWWGSRMRQVRQGLNDVRVISRFSTGVALSCVGSADAGWPPGLTLFPRSVSSGELHQPNSHALPWQPDTAIFERGVAWEAENPRSKILAVSAEGTRTHMVVHLFRPRPCGDSSENELGALAYLSRTPGAKRWVVVLPIWGSSTYPSNKIVRRLLGGTHGRQTTSLLFRDRRVSFATRRSSRLPPRPSSPRSLAHCVLHRCDRGGRSRLHRLGDGAVRNRSSSVGIVGFSIGGIIGSLVMGRDPRLAAGVFVMVGGHLDEILAHCKWGQREVREHAAAALGWNVEKLKSVIKAPLSAVDPCCWPAGLTLPLFSTSTPATTDASRDRAVTISGGRWRTRACDARFDHRNSFLSMTFLGFDVTTVASSPFSTAGSRDRATISDESELNHHHGKSS